MALTNNGTRYSIPSEKVPSGYSRAIPTTFSDYDYKTPELVFSITKATVENADAGVTTDNIIDDATEGIDKQVEDKINNDYDTTGNDFEVYTVWKDVEANVGDYDDDFYTNDAAAFQCRCEIYIKKTS